MSVILRFVADSTVEMSLSSRDCAILMDSDFIEGVSFCREIGVFDHMSLSEGIQKDTAVDVLTSEFLVTIQLLLKRLLRDRELLMYDYSCEWKARDDLAEITATTDPVVAIRFRTKGFCKLAVMRSNGDRAGRVLATIDLRERNNLWRSVLKECVIKRRKGQFDLCEKISGLEAFLSTCTARVTRVLYVTRG